MTTLLVIKERIKKFYEIAGVYIEPVIKMLVAMVVFMMINRELGYDSRLTGITVVLVLSLVCAFLPSSVLVFLAGIIACLHVFAASKILGTAVVLILLILYLLFVRLTPKQGYVLVAVPILYILKVPYCVPVIMGLIATPISVIPVGCGVVVYYLFATVKQVAGTTMGTSIEDIIALYTLFINTFLKNKLMIYTLVVYAVVVLVTYIIRRLPFNYVSIIAIVTGCLSNVIGFLLFSLKGDVVVNITDMILGTTIALIVAVVINFFRRILDYTAVERVQFEDDDYYYYVKAVPKMNVTAPQKNVKTISEKEENFEE